MTNHTKVYTVSDAREEKWLADRRVAARFAKAASRAARFAIPADLHPAIGVLTRGSGVAFYAFVDGVYAEGTVAELTALLNAGGATA